MRPRGEKARPGDAKPQPTSNPEAPDAPELNARMHFYAVRNAGDQLRWADAPRSGKKPDRMVGR